MGKPVTLLQGLFGHAMSFGADYIQVENIDGHEWVFTTIDGEKARIGKYPTSGSYSDELLGNLAAAIKKPVRAVIEGKVYIFKVRSAPVHAQTRPVSGVHLSLHEDPPRASGGIGPGALLPGFPAFDSRNDQDSGAELPD